MAWTTPRTWVDEELITHSILNTHIRDNLIYLKAYGDASAPWTTAKQLGSFNGATPGAGIAVSSSVTGALKSFADDNDAAIGSGYLVRSIWGRLLMGYAGTQECEAFGVQGNVVYSTCNPNHNDGGVLGSWEARGTVVTAGTAQDNIHAGVVGRVGAGSTVTLTISANSVLAGLAAMSNINTGSTFTNSGVYAGLYIGAWASADDWAYGIYIEDKVTTDIRFQGGTTITDAAAGLYIASGNLGIGAAADANVGIYITGVFTDTDNSGKSGVRANMQFAKTSAAMTSAGWGLYGQAYLDSTNTQNWTHAHAGLRGVCGFVGSEAGSTGTVTVAASFFANANFANAATITNWHGVHVCTPTVAGSKVINAYGIYICDQDQGATLNYALYTGTGIVRFGDRVDLSGVTMNVASDNISVINIGTYDTGVSVGALSDNTFAVMNNLTSTADDSYWFMNEYMRISITTADQTNKSFVNLAIRQTVSKPVAATYGIQAHLKFDGTGAVGTEVIALSAMLEGAIAATTGLQWAFKADQRATGLGSTRGSSAAVFLVTTANSGNIAYLENLSGATVSDAIYIHNAGTMTNGIYMAGTMTAGLNLDGATLTNDIVFQGGTTLTDDGTNLTLAGANLTVPTLTATTITDGTATLTGGELDGATIDAAVAKGTWTASGTWQIPAVTLGGTITLNNKTLDAGAGRMEITTTGEGYGLQIQSTNNAIYGVDLNLWHDSASPAIDDRIARIRFYGADSEGTSTEYVTILTRIVSPTHPNESGKLEWNIRNSGSTATRMTLTGSAELAIGGEDQSTIAITGGAVRASHMVGGTTTNGAGADLTIAAGKGTGAGDVGQVIFQTPRVAGSGTTLQALTTIMVLDENKINLSGYLNIYSTDVDTAVAGDLWYSTTDNTLEYYNGAAVKVIAVVAGISFAPEERVMFDHRWEVGDVGLVKIDHIKGNESPHGLLYPFSRALAEAEEILTIKQQIASLESRLATIGG